MSPSPSGCMITQSRMTQSSGYYPAVGVLGGPMVEGHVADWTREAGTQPGENEFESGSAPRLIRATVFLLVPVVRGSLLTELSWGIRENPRITPSVSALAAGSRMLQGSRGFAACS